MSSARLTLVPPRASASASPGFIEDAEERALALDISRSFLVEAPAGSGKTGLLIQRFLKLIAAVEHPAEVLAITFTRQAAAEMRERVYGQLTAAREASAPQNAFDRSTRPLAEAALGRDRQLGWNLLDQPRKLNIRTIDSVCADIARDLPILSGSGGGLTPVEDSKPLRAEAARQTILELGNPQTPGLSEALRTLLLHRDGDLANVEKLLTEMLGWRDQWGELIPRAAAELTDQYLDEHILPRFDQALDQAVCRSLTRLTNLLPPPVLARLAALADEMSAAEGYKGAPSPIAICRSRTQPPQEKAEDLEHWRALIHLLVTPSTRDYRKALNKNFVHFEILKHHKQELLSIIDSLSQVDGLLECLCDIGALPPAVYPREQWPVAKALFRVLSRALLELQLVFAARRTCDFTEIALLARTALTRDEALDDLQHATGHTLQHLLVDEMQDTSTPQYELIQLLTRSWDGGSQTVFLVGDPKQSIYLFRQARVERFVHTMHTARLGASAPGHDPLPLSVLHLATNFRSQKTMVAAFNATFTHLFPAHPDSTRPALVPYREASAARPGTEAAAEVWHLDPIPYTSDKEHTKTLKTQQAQTHSAEIRRILEQWRARPLPPGRTEPWKIAILVAGRSHLPEIVRTLKQTPAIPFRAIKTEPLGERQEILDLLALTRALQHPADRTAWLALLRTPWCGLALADLLTLTGQDDPGFRHHTVLELISTRGELLSADGIARLEPFWQALTAALAERTRMPLARLIERTWRLFNGPLFANEEQLQNITRFLLLLHELEVTLGSVDIPTLSTQLAMLYAAPASHADAVDLMTIHGAKGLEWDVVLVPALERPGKNATSQLLSWLETDGGTDGDDQPQAHGLLAPISGKGVGTPELNRWMRLVDAGREAAERARLFYVACTRAREELHLFAAPAMTAKGEISRRPGSLLATIWPAAAQHLAEPAQAAQPEPQPLLALAAQAETPQPASPRRLIQRIPQALLPTQAAPLATHPLPQPFARPEGSFTARVFGNALHAFLESAATQIARRTDAADLLEELPGWMPRVKAVLRGSGLPPSEVDRLSASVLLGLRNTLSSPEGRWLLSPHPEAGSESALTRFAQGDFQRVRLDRTFLAGSTPESKGETHLWIVDYKTTTHGQAGLAQFLDEQQMQYQGQLEAYAAALGVRGLPVRVALFYPMVAALRWWAPNG